MCPNILACRPTLKTIIYQKQQSYSNFVFYRRNHKRKAIKKKYFTLVEAFKIFFLALLISDSGAIAISQETFSVFSIIEKNNDNSNDKNGIFVFATG